MDEEQQKRKRSRRGKRRHSKSASVSQELSLQTTLEEQAKSEGAQIPSPAEAAQAGGSQSRKSRPSVGKSSGKQSDSTSPMDFWRSGRARSHRERQQVPQGGPGFWRAIRSFHVPAWMPVGVIIGATFGILGLLFFIRSASGAPRIGDHWHASYQVVICGEKQPAMPAFEGPGSSPGTHGDGVLHLHPFSTAAEGSANSLQNYFKTGGGTLSGSEIRSVGFSKTWKNGDRCDDGTTGALQVFVNGKKVDDFGRYIAKDGDQLKIIFGPAQSLVQLDDRQVIDESEAKRTVEIAITGDATSSAFSPAAPTVKAGETVKLLVRNQSTASHQMRISGPDGKYSTSDDFVVVPFGSDPKLADKGQAMQPGQDGFAVVRFDDPGQIPFEDPASADSGTKVSGTIIVEGVGSGTPTPRPGGPAEALGSMTLTDSGYDPATLTLAGAAGKNFAITLTNIGKFVHNLQIAGPDGEFNSDDDITSADVPVLGSTPAPSPAPTDTSFGSTTTSSTPAPTPSGVNIVVMTGKIDTAGTYQYRDQFHPEITGEIIIK